MDTAGATAAAAITAASAAPAAGGGKQKRKADELNTAEDSTKVARPDPAAAAADPNTESAVSVYALCASGKPGRLGADPAKDKLVTVAIAHHLADKDRPGSGDPGPITTHVLYYDVGNVDESAAAPPAASGGSTTFTRCAGEADMLVKWKAVWDAWDPAVVVGHQLKIFDLWFILSRAVHVGVPEVAALGRGGVKVQVDGAKGSDIVVGAGGMYCYPVQTYKRAHQSAAAAPALMLPGGGIAAGGAAPSTFNRRLEIPGRAVDDVWERVQGRFTLKAYDVDTLTRNFVGAPTVSEGSGAAAAAGRTGGGGGGGGGGAAPPPPPPPMDLKALPGSAGASARDMLSVRQLVRSLPDVVAFCFKCKQPGHTAKQCPVGLLCKICGKQGHKVTHCPEASCSVCGRKGHMAMTCYSRQACTKCGQTGHTEKFCRQDRLCTSCGQRGHTVERCFNLNPCSHCGGRHQAERCYKAHVCTICGRKGHMEDRCFSNPNNPNQRANASAPSGPAGGYGQFGAVGQQAQPGAGAMHMGMMQPQQQLMMQRMMMMQQQQQRQPQQAAVGMFQQQQQYQQQMMMQQRQQRVPGQPLPQQQQGFLRPAAGVGVVGQQFQAGAKPPAPGAPRYY